VLAEVVYGDRDVNAVEHMARQLPPETVRRLAALEVRRFTPGAQLGQLGGPGRRAPRVLDTDEARACVLARWGGDLCGLLNAMTRGELAALAQALDVDVGAAARSPELRERVWDAGARLERGDAVIYRPTRDKGAWGLRAAALLGIVERGHDEPDWRGDVEVKTVPVALDPSGWWRVVEDPAIAMLGADGGGGALAKLQRTLWLVRADVGDGDATILSWYLLDAHADIARLVRRYLHDRPKGPRGTDQRGLYLHKRFFADAGLLATLNGPA